MNIFNICSGANHQWKFHIFCSWFFDVTQCVWMVLDAYLLFRNVYCLLNVNKFGTKNHWKRLKFIIVPCLFELWEYLIYSTSPTIQWVSLHFSRFEFRIFSGIFLFSRMPIISWINDCDESVWTHGMITAIDGKALDVCPKQSNRLCHFSDSCVLL